MTVLRFLLLVLVNSFVMVASSHDKLFVSERVFIAPLSQCVDLEDTIRVAGQVLSTDFSDFYPYSRYVYVELVDDGSHVVTRNKVRMADDGTFYTNIPLTKKEDKGIYYLRGYTQFMRNRGNALFPLNPIYIGVEPGESPCLTGMGAMFFPEGGHLACGGTVQNVGVYLYDGSKSPVAAGFAVLKNMRDTVCCGKTDKYGLATVSFIPESGSMYVLSSAYHTFHMPQPLDIPTLRATVNRSRLVCNIVPGSSNAAEMSDSLHVYIYHSSFGIRQLSLKNGVGMADVSDCAPGLLTMWLTDLSGSVLAQRLLWVGNYCDEAEPYGFSVHTGGLAGDTVYVNLDPGLGHGSIFVRFAPENSCDTASAFEILNLRNEVLSPIPFPKASAGENSRQIMRSVENWLLSTGQTMIGADLLRADSVNYVFPVEDALCVSGSVFDGKRPLREANVQIYNSQNNDAVSVSTDTDGHFNAVVKDFLDGGKFYVQAYNGKGKTGEYTYKLDKTDFPPVVDMYANMFDAEETSADRLLPFAQQVDTVKRHNVDEVVVKRNRPVEKGYNWVRTKNVFNYYDREFLDHHPNIMTIKDAILYTGKVKVSNGDNCLSWKSEKLQGLPQQHVSSLDNENTVYSQIAIVLNGMKVERNLSDILSWSISDVETIELVQPLDIRSIWHNAGFGFFDIKMRTIVRQEPEVSNGATIQPLGIAMPVHPYVYRLPEKDGVYKMMVDVVSADRRIRSIVREIEVKGKND